MKSYKDIDKDIILNAPEGAMWWCDNNRYYKFTDGVMYYYASWGWWGVADNFQCVAEIQKGRTPDIHRVGLNPIPLPNIEIPWEATEDSKCPVPVGSQCKITLLDGRVDTCKGYSRNRHNWALTTQNPITSYKIIDEDYLPTEQEEDIVSYKLPLYTSAHKIEEKSMEQYSLPLPKTKEQLISNLEFLQILHDKFPSIRESVEQYMNSQLDIFICEDWENEG